MSNQEKNRSGLEGYQPPAGQSERFIETSPKKGGRAAFVGVGITVIALLATLVLAGLVVIGIVEVRWDSALVPLAFLLLGFLPSLFGLVISVVACFVDRNWIAAVGVPLGIVSALISLAAAWASAMASLASHPI